MPKLTVAEWSHSLGISRQQGYAAVKRGGIPVVDGRVDSDSATAIYRQTTRLRAGGASSAAPPAGDETPTNSTSEYAQQRARREAAEAEIAEMKAAEMSGKYLVKAEVDAAIFTIARALRDSLTNCQRRIAADVAAMVTADECESVIEREHRALLNSMTQDLRALVGAPTEGEGA